MENTDLKATEEIKIEEASNEAENASIGSQTDRNGGINAETAEFLKGLWR